MVSKLNPPIFRSLDFFQISFWSVLWLFSLKTLFWSFLFGYRKRFSVSHTVFGTQVHFTGRTIILISPCSFVGCSLRTWLIKLIVHSFMLIHITQMLLIIEVTDQITFLFLSKRHISHYIMCIIVLMNFIGTLEENVVVFVVTHFTLKDFSRTGINNKRKWTISLIGPSLSCTQHKNKDWSIWKFCQ